LPDKRRHRGPHPQDEELFSAEQRAVLREALEDYAQLLSKEYAAKSSLKLVGDHFALQQRQRTALMRCGCSDEARSQRREKQVGLAGLVDEGLLLDGYNVITTVEAALAGGVILTGRDGCYRDLASVHGTFRKVEETVPALKLIGEFLGQTGAGKCTWYLDRPVSNSGRLKVLLLELAEEKKWKWQVEVVYSPDGILSRTEEIVATSDSVILDSCARWFNLGREVIEEYVREARIVNLSI
jgi:hypothetical protein